MNASDDALIVVPVANRSQRPNNTEPSGPSAIWSLGCRCESLVPKTDWVICRCGGGSIRP